MYYIFQCKYYYIFKDYVNSLKANSKKVQIVDINPQKNPTEVINFIKNNNNDEDKFIFIFDFPYYISDENTLKKCYFINTEQFGRDGGKNIKKYNKNITIIDYSLSNVKLLNSPHKKIYIPYQINNSEIFDHLKTEDIAMVGWKVSPRRDTIYEKFINNSVNLHKIEGFYEDRDNQLLKHKILVNVHAFDNWKTFETHRCTRCTLNKMIIISEEVCDDIEDLELKDYIIFCKYDDIFDKTLEVLNNYDYYYNKIFGNFDLEKLKTKFKNIDELLA